ncbi:MAG: hypothetical protein JWN50_751 [Parcubacteria group bacterium]|nr:hypothetical protein [Parcubacteria group bacterium]
MQCPCICGGLNWRQGGGSFSPDLVQHSNECSVCGRRAVEMSHRGGQIFIVNRKKEEFSQGINIWMEEVLLPTWRNRETALKAARLPMEDESWDQVCDALSLPRRTRSDGVPEDKMEAWRKEWDKVDPHMRSDLLYVTPIGFEAPVVYARVPRELLVYAPVLDRSGALVWRVLTSKATKDLPLPRDPVRVRHDRLFTKIFAEVEKKLGMKFDLERIENQYCGSIAEPWYRIMFGENTVVVGPRKRVVAVKVSAPEAIPIDRIRIAAEGASYSADGSWQSEASAAKEVEVHAYTPEKVIELLTIIGEATLGIEVG